MNPTIKARIEKIKNGEVPEGYKRTKIGIVPTDWKERKLKNYFTRLTRKNAENNQNVLTISAQYGLISQEDFFNKSVASENKSNYFLLLKGDFAYNKSYSNGYPYGAIKRLEYYEKGIVSPLYICMEPQNSFVADYFVQYFEGGLLNGEIHAFAQEGARNHGLLNIAVDDFFNTNVVVPCEVEQQRIAEILATQDKVIELKEKLLKEKQRQKKYLMQQLLTGKKRLLGFSGEWQTVKLSAIATPIKRKVEDKSYEVLSITAGVGFVNQAEKFGKEIAGEQYKQYTLLLRTEFSYNKGNSKKYPQGCIYPLENREKAAVPNVFISFRLNSSVCWYKFYKSLFESGALNKQLFRVINSGVRNDGLLNINSDDFFNCMLVVPEYDEQTAIAQILSTVDKEIEFLKKGIEQEKLKKKTLMQLLLTGIVRVNEVAT